ncbi:MAG: thioredoxin-disulfide reductase [Bdellovibrionales bacterium]
MSDAKVENVIIIGSGPAGLTAAIYAARANLNPLMIEGEEVGGQLMTTTEVENYPGFTDGISGPDLMDVTKKQAARFGTRFISKNVTKVDLSVKPFKVWIGEEEYQAKVLIISTGASAKYLGLESEKKFMNRGVSACATCDGAFFQNVEVAVVGGGDTAMEEALFLTRFATKVHVVHRREEFRASKIMADRVKAHEKIEIHWNSELKEVLGDKRGVTHAKLFNNKTNEDMDIPLEGIFIAIGHKPNVGFLDGQLETDDLGYLVTKPGTTQTNVEGVYACGDVQDHIYRQAITAAGTGCMAAIESERWLEDQGL